MENNRELEFKSLVKNSILQAIEIFKIEVLNDEHIDGIVDRIFQNILNEVNKKENNENSSK